MENPDQEHCDICSKDCDPDLLESAPINPNYEPKKSNNLTNAENALRVLHGTCFDHGKPYRNKADCIRCIVKTVANALGVEEA